MPGVGEEELLGRSWRSRVPGLGMRDTSRPGPGSRHRSRAEGSGTGSRQYSSGEQESVRGLWAVHPGADAPEAMEGAIWNLPESVGGIRLLVPAALKDIYPICLFLDVCVSALALPGLTGLPPPPPFSPMPTHSLSLLSSPSSVWLPRLPQSWSRVAGAPDQEVRF